MHRERKIEIVKIIIIRFKHGYYHSAYGLTNNIQLEEEAKKKLEGATHGRNIVHVFYLLKKTEIR